MFSHIKAFVAWSVVITGLCLFINVALLAVDQHYNVWNLYTHAYVSWPGDSSLDFDGTAWHWTTNLLAGPTWALALLLAFKAAHEPQAKVILLIGGVIGFSSWFVLASLSYIQSDTVWVGFALFGGFEFGTGIFNSLRKDLCRLTSPLLGVPLGLSLAHGVFNVREGWMDLGVLGAYVAVGVVFGSVIQWLRKGAVYHTALATPVQVLAGS